MKNLSWRSGVQQGTREGDALVKDKVSQIGVYIGSLHIAIPVYFLDFHVSCHLS